MADDDDSWSDWSDEDKAEEEAAGSVKEPAPKPAPVAPPTLARGRQGLSFWVVMITQAHFGHFGL